uniref:B30.2/SPRY domain-containing protein n=1 Tax=Acrobeloides nanus TaxID=290746 RepID=A0A914ES74_9BILA
MRSKKRDSSNATPKPTPSTVCYCNGQRELGTLELNCQGCKKWFHSRCLKDLTEFYGLPFMVCYVFNCQDCSSDKKESWTPKQANFSHMCVMAIANMTFNYFEKISPDVVKLSQEQTKYFNIEKEVIPFFEENWESLTSQTRRKTNSWHASLQQILTNDTYVFTQKPDNKNEVALKERNLLEIGPMLDAIKQLGRRPAASQPVASLETESKVEDDGPKTRGASKRKNVENTTLTSIKKTKSVVDFSSVEVEGIDGLVDFPFNREGYRYYQVEKDAAVDNRDLFDKEGVGDSKPIPSHVYRIKLPTTVTLSPNDRAHQLRLESDKLTITGFEGYAVARATHSVSHGKWYYEVEFYRQSKETSSSPEAHVRIGWAQAYSVLQACLGYTKFSYSWRSHKGTIFHEAKGKHYMNDGGFKEGDILGCLIDLPELDEIPRQEFSQFLPPSYKELPLVNFKNHFFYEEKEEVTEELKKLNPLKGSKIEFFKNGKPCGTAFADINAGFYYPAVSLYYQATLRCNFGPKFKYSPPAGVKPMSARAEEIAVEQAMSDLIFLVEHKEMIDQVTAEFFA